MRAGSVWKSFRYAFSGMVWVVRTQRNVRIQLAVAVAVVPLGLWLRLPPAHWALLALTIGVVLAAEIGNTALETVVDLVSPDYHPLAKAAKDVSSAAVLCLALTSVVVGGLVLGPPLWMRLTG